MQTISSHIHCGPTARLFVLKPPKIFFLGLSPTMRPKVLLSVHDLKFRRQERAKLDRMRRQLLIPLKKVPTILKFNSLTFVFPPPKNTTQQKSNHSYFSPSNPGSPYFSLFPRKNLFSPSKTTHLGLEKGKRTPFDLYPLSSSSSFSIHAVATEAVANIAAVVVIFGYHHTTINDRVEVVANRRTTIVASNFSSPPYVAAPLAINLAPMIVDHY